MSKLEQLIKDLCPNGVECKSLKDICKIVTAPKKINSREYMKEGKYPIVDQGKNYIVGYTDDGDALLPKEEYVLFGDHTREVKYVNFQFAQGADGLKILQPKLPMSTRYAYYAISSLNIPARGYNRHWSIAQDFVIPVPPIEVQNEIVRILDTFTGLTAELTARKQQYEYYRNSLLNFENSPISLIKDLCPNGVEYKKIKDICVRQKGTPITASEMKRIAKVNGAVRVFAAGNTFVDTDYDDVSNVITVPSVIVKSRGNIGFEYYDKPFTHKNEMWSYSAKDTKINLKFLYHYLQNRADVFQKKAKTGKLPQISTPDTDNFTIPVPPIEVQNEIVRILDRFEALCNDISVGLPAEIKARQQQYEHYRNKLLTFEEVKA